MSEEAAGFKGAFKDEKIQFFWRKHWTRFVRTLFFAAVTAALMVMILVMLGHLFALLPFGFVRTFFAFFVMVVFYAGFNIFCLQFIAYFLDTVIVTDYRILIVRRTVFVRHDNDAIDLTKIQDMGVEAHGLLRNYLNYGEIIVQLSTNTPPVYLTYVPNPHYYLERANRVKRDYIAKRQYRRQTLEDAIQTT